ncbi:SMODS domain-containing nucleotidyltransferase [Mesorhizobium sp. ES1-6]|uniref:SMODS domain-containing nucleotidyltransferase n=1 Tax=Mesorhizobium sp. ES1-6 TaxID=2876626 RepID=UPI001CCC2CC2|nr:nucleotidyltransferase [Mesorhizobium sp. ES1-6]MBZ9801095.1 nucleotidyltransferase [Mesorhizobium sp. ES1-6]
MLANIRFEEFLRDIEPNQRVIRSASEAHYSIRNHLRAHPDFSKRLNRDFLAGSYSRHTAIRPSSVGGDQFRPDVDVYVELAYGFSADPRDILKKLRRVLQDDYNVERMNRRSVRIRMPLIDVDVVPLIHSGHGFKIPDRRDEEWWQTDPLFHNEWSAAMNAEFQGRFKPLVKLIKWWRRVNFGSRRPKGFALEILTAEHAPFDEYHYGEAFAQFLASVAKAYGGRPYQRPKLADPAVRGADILSKVSRADWNDFMDLVTKHARTAREAQENDDEGLAMQLWRQVLGPRLRW